MEEEKVDQKHDLSTIYFSNKTFQSIDYVPHKHVITFSLSSKLGIGFNASTHLQNQCFKHITRH